MSQVHNELSVKASKQRRTVEGTPCKKIWKHNSRTVIGCTTNIDPDGLQEKEWCRTTETKEGKEWGYCDEDLDYDSIHQAISDFYEADIKLLDSVSRQVSRIKPLIVGVKTRLQTLESLQRKNAFALTQIESTKHQADSLFGVFDGLISKISGLDFAIKDVNKKNQSFPKVDPMKVDSQCLGNPFYEELNSSGGITINYFDNEVFQGKSVYSQSNMINFLWNGESPAEGINQANFSLIIKGFIKPPKTGKFVFKFYTDAAVSLVINNKSLVDHFMSDRKKGHRGAKWGKSVESKPIWLNGGEMYSFLIKYWRSEHVEYNVNFESFLILKWKEDEMNLQQIDPFYLSKSLNAAPLVLTDYKEEELSLQFLHEYDKAFKDNPFMIMHDIPLHLQGAHQLRGNHRQTKPIIEFTINRSVNVYLAFQDNDDTILVPKGFKFAKEKMSVLLLEGDPAKGEHTTVKKSIGFSIFVMENMAPGRVRIPVTPNKMYITFVQNFQASQEVSSCGGDEQTLNLQHEDFRSCNLPKDSKLDCQGAFTPEFDGKTTWKLQPSFSVSSWIEVWFKGIYQLQNIRIRAGPNQKNNIKKLGIKFSDNTSQVVNLTAIYDPIQLKFTSGKTKNIKFTILEVFHQELETSASFEITGFKCESLTDEQTQRADDVIYAQCGDTIFNHQQLQGMNLKVKDKITISCSGSCNPDDSRIIYGTDLYAPETGLCIGAFHSGSIHLNGGKFAIEIMPGQAIYKSSQNLGVKSHDHNSTDLALQFISLQLDVFEPFVGMMVDVDGDKPAEAIIKDVKLIQPGLYQIDVLKSGQAQSEIMHWPDKNVLFCGRIFVKRDCELKSRDPREQGMIKKNFCFTRQEHCADGDLKDEGQQLQAHKDIEYGWTFTNPNFFCENKTTDESLQCYAGFSKRYTPLCTEKPGESEDCKANYWTIKNIPNGHYRVAVYVMDQKNNFIQYLSVNGKAFFERKECDKCSMHTTEEVIVTNGSIILSDDCPTECDFVQSRVSRVTIEQMPDKLEMPPQAKNTIPGPGNTRSSGECDDVNSDEIHMCTFRNIDDNNTKAKLMKCTGQYFLMQIPGNNKHISLRQQYICLQMSYKDLAECTKYCLPETCKVIGPSETICYDNSEVNDDQE